MNTGYYIKRMMSLFILTAIVFCTGSAYADEGGGKKLNISVTNSGNICYEAFDDLTRTYAIASKVKDDFVITLTDGMSRISRVEIEWAEPSGESISYYKILRSPDGVNYIEVKDRASKAADDRIPLVQPNMDKTSYITNDTFDNPIYAKKLKLSVFYSSASLPAAVREIRVYGENAGSEDLISKGKPLVFECDGDSSFDGSKLNDGIYTNGIEGFDAATRTFSAPFSAVIDLGGIYSLSDIYCTFTDRQKDVRNYYSYTISTGTDGVNYTDAAFGDKDSKSGMLHNFMTTITGNYWSNGFYLTQNNLGGKYARYVKINVTGYSYKWVYGIKEIEIIGKPVETADRFSASYDETGRLENVELSNELRSSPLYLGEPDSGKKFFLFESTESLFPLAATGDEVYIPESAGEQVICFDVLPGEVFDITLKVCGSLYAFQAELVYNPAEAELLSCESRLFDGGLIDMVNGAVSYNSGKPKGYFASAMTDNSCRILASEIDKSEGMADKTVKLSFRAVKNAKTVMFLKGSKCFFAGESGVEYTDNCLSISREN